jgi:hypothetical protein
MVTFSDPEPCQGDTITLTAMGGDSYLWNTSDTTPSIMVTQAGTYWVDISDSGCAGRDSVIVAFLPLPQPVINQLGQQLCLTTTFASYQWYQNGNPIPGDTNICFTPGVSGSFSVVVTGTNGCIGESTVFTFVGASEAMSAQGFEVFPNPTRDQVTIRMEQPLTVPGEVLIYDLRGKVVIKRTFDRIDSQMRVDLHDVADGTYLLEIKSEEFKGRTRVVRMR